jgi:hypothetical protein
MFAIRAGLQAATPPKSAIEEFARHGCNCCKSTLLEVGQQKRGVSFSRCCDSPEPQKKGLCPTRVTAVLEQIARFRSSDTRRL